MPDRNLPKEILTVPFRFSSKTLQRFGRIVFSISKFPLLTSSEQEVLVNVLAHSQDGAPPEIKLKIHQVLKRLSRRRRKPFGMIVVLGWKREWEEKYASLPDSSQDLFAKKSFNFASASEDRAIDILSGLADFDGAILMNTRGEMVASGIYLENMKPKKVAEILGSEKTQDLSSRFGFVKKVHTRHLAAIATSYWLKGTTVFVVSEEDQSLRILEDGKIIWSTIKKEIWPNHQP